MEFLMILSALVIPVTPATSGSWIMGLRRGFNPSKPDLSILSFLKKSLFLSNQSPQPSLRGETLLPMAFNKSASSTHFTCNTFDFTFSSTATSSEPNTVMPTSSGPTKGPSSSSSMKELLLMARRITPSAWLKKYPDEPELRSRGSSSSASASMASSCSSSPTSRASMVSSPVMKSSLTESERRESKLTSWERWGTVARRWRRETETHTNRRRPETTTHRYTPWRGRRRDRRFLSIFLRWKILNENAMNAMFQVGPIWTIPI